MKKIFSVSVITTMLLVGCSQEMTELQPQPDPSGESGSADFTKFISIGNSLTAGYQASALFQEGQDNSYPKVMAEQFAIVSTNDSFDQPDTQSTNGCYNPSGGCTLGRLVLYDPDGPGTAYSVGPAPAGTSGMPAPFNTTQADHIKSVSPYTGTKTSLNNFGVPGIILAQILTPATGGPSSSNPAYNPYYARFATNPSTDGLNGSTILGDALATQPTFFSFWLGNNDVLGYATTGGSGAIPMTEAATFTGYYQTAINTILGSNANLKGVVANIPDVTSIPFFKTVAYNAIPLDQANATALNDGYASFNGGIQAYNAGALPGQTGPPPANMQRPTISFAAGYNAIVIDDETLPDLTAYGIPSIRQATATDLVCLTAGAVLGKDLGGGPKGLQDSMEDNYILLPSEITAIKNRIADFNASIATIVAGSSNRLALADVNAKFTALALGQTPAIDNIPVNATFAPPYGLFSEDGVHPNNRGSAYIAKIFIEAINAKFGSTVPLPSIAKDLSTHLPVNGPL